MRFGTKLKQSIYPPWKNQYINYDKLKELLREPSSGQASPVSQDQDEEWTEEDEGAFVDELVNVQLEKVHGFQNNTLRRLQSETAELERQLEPLGAAASEMGKERSDISQDGKEKILKDAVEKLGSLLNETTELERYSRLNYTGFFKAAKKHDRKRGQSYRVLPLLRVRLNALPFNSEEYSPIVNRLSLMLSFARQSLEGKTLSLEEGEPGRDRYTAYKCWIHPENLLEVKTIILRRLPLLVYNPQTSRIAQGTTPDPTVTSIYFDNPKFDLYTQKVSDEHDVDSLRLRWYGPLSDQTDILFEQKMIKEGGISEELRFPIKSKHIMPFIRGDYKMEKAISKIKDVHGADSDKAKQFESAVHAIQDFISKRKLQPMVRANYARAAFEIPGDDRVRISIDSNLAFIREDAVDLVRTCRDPDDWHRRDIDANHAEYPFDTIHRGEVNLFPYAILEIKIRSGKEYEWVNDLMTSHLVKPIPRFSKFIHGIASLFEDYVNTFPFWLGTADSDILRDPQEAFEAEQQRKAKVREEELVVGSLFGAHSSPARRAALRLMHSPAGSPPGGGSSGARYPPPKATPDMTRQPLQPRAEASENFADSDEEVPMEHRPEVSTAKNLRAQVRHLRAMLPYGQTDTEHLPPGIKEPETWIKDQGDVKVEAKVWLANQRTFVKWQHISVLLASLSLGLYNAAGRDNPIARWLAIVYTGFAVFAGAWGWGVYMWRNILIRKRSPRDFDNRFGPVVVCAGLALALVLNFIFKFQTAFAEYSKSPSNSKLSEVLDIPHAAEL